MPNGAQVSIAGATGGWYHVGYKGFVGYASARYISTTSAAPAQAKAVKKPRPTPPYNSSDDSNSGGSGGYQY